MKRPTLELIAKECGVTKGLVSRALAGKNNVSDGMREKIIRKATELGYDTKRLKTSKSNSSHVLLITSTRILFKEDFWQPIITSISSTLSRQNLIVEYMVFDEDKIDENLIKKLKDSNCGAFVVVHVTMKPIMDVLLKKDKPIVVVDPKNFYSEATQFKFSNYDSSYTATQKLIEQGHKHIAFYGSDSHSTSFRERHEGYLSCMEAHKESAQPYSLIFDNKERNFADEEMLTSALTKSKITAIVCANDIIAVNAIKTIHRLGKSVPKDISIIGFDNIKAGELMTPALSTFNIPRQQLGEEVARYVTNVLKYNRIKLSQVVVQCDYIERNSNRKIGA